jgi:NDP-sugar pyrophosphorylase family protein
MSAFVILAAGRGTRIGRVGESLHKALVPLGPKAVLSHLIDLAPDDQRIIICTGHREDQILEYLSLAHPGLEYVAVPVQGWDQPGGGPGHSLLAAKNVIGDDDFTFTSCDTLWDNDPTLFKYYGTSWSAVAAVPAGTPPNRWCRMQVNESNVVEQIFDKRAGGDGALAYVGLSHIAFLDTDRFWSGLEVSRLHDGERQVSGGLDAVRAAGNLTAQSVQWTDVGDETSYRRAVASYVGYDWTKTDEATYVLPDTGRVVKFFSDPEVTHARHERGYMLGSAVPRPLDYGRQFMAYEYVKGQGAYQWLEEGVTWYLERTAALLQWAESVLWQPMQLDTGDGSQFEHACMSFYRDKTFARVDMLPRDLRAMCLDILSRIDWDELATCGIPSGAHLDFNFGNIIVTDTGKFCGIDWRQDFNGLPYGDKRYDYAKLLTGCVVHWDNARRGDFRRWDAGEEIGEVITEHIYKTHGIDVANQCAIIGALSLLNSAPLHAPPLDEVLVARGCAWLEGLL